MHTYICTANIHACKIPYINACMNVHIHIYLYVKINKYIHTYMHTYAQHAQTHVHVCMYRVRKHTLISTYTWKRIYTHNLHIYIQTFIKSSGSCEHADEDSGTIKGGVFITK
jgi:hypothetical protein